MTKGPFITALAGLILSAASLIILALHSLGAI